MGLDRTALRVKTAPLLPVNSDKQRIDPAIEGCSDDGADVASRTAGSGQLAVLGGSVVLSLLKMGLDDGPGALLELFWTQRFRISCDPFFQQVRIGVRPVIDRKEVFNTREHQGGMLVAQERAKPCINLLEIPQDSVLRLMGGILNAHPMSGKWGDASSRSALRAWIVVTLFFNYIVTESFRKTLWHAFQLNPTDIETCALQ